MTSVAVANPTVARRELCVRMHTLHEQHRSTAEEIGKRLGASASQVSRLTNGNRGYQLTDVRTIADWYELDEPERTLLLELASIASKRAWWQKMTTNEHYRTLIGMEQNALSINEYCSQVLPGLLQTEQYGRAAAKASVAGLSDERAAAAAERRITRQSVLEGPDAPFFRAVIDEAALARGVKDRTIMAEQLDHLIGVAQQQEKFTIRIIGFEEGIHAGPWSHFTLLEMPEPLPTFAYSEDKKTTSATPPLENAEVEQGLWRSLLDVALSPSASTERIQEYRDRLG